MEKNEQRIQPFVPLFLELLPVEKEPYQCDALMVLQRMERSKEQDDILFDICSRIWIKVNSISSLRCNAFQCVVSVSRKFPEIAAKTIGLAYPFSFTGHPPVACTNQKRNFLNV